MQQLTETQKAYLAGMIDGEGCITIACSRGRYYSLFLVITGTTKSHIEACKNMADVGVIREQDRSKSGRATTIQWRISGPQVAVLLRLVLPYMILKVHQAKLAIHFQEHLDNSPFYNRHHPMPKAVLEYRQELAQLMKDLKLDGRVYDDSVVEVSVPDSPWEQPALLK